jgi:hypothetical protein
MNEGDMSAKIMVDGNPAPIFLLPHSSLIAGAGYDITTTHAAAILVADTVANGAIPRVIPRGFIWSDGDYAPIEVTATISNATAGALITLPLLLDIDTRVTLGSPPNDVTVTSGLGRLSIEVPVVMYTEADSDNQDIPDLKEPVLWFIRGGLNNALIDLGPSFNNTRGSLGGAVLIGVGNILAGAGGFIVSGTYTP